MDISTYERLLAEQVGGVFRRNSALKDHRQRYPWVTNSLGDPFSGIWFVAENPSLKQLEKLERQRGHSLAVEDQWHASPGDRLFREALAHAGFKRGGIETPDGWRCYVTNVIKGAEYVGEWNQQDTATRRAVAEMWAPVMRWQIETARPTLIVMMGRKVEKAMNDLGRRGLIALPPTRFIEHYSYVAMRPTRDRLRPSDPRRVAAYHESITALATSWSSERALLP